LVFVRQEVCSKMGFRTDDQKNKILRKATKRKKHNKESFGRAEKNETQIINCSANRDSKISKYNIYTLMGGSCCGNRDIILVFKFNEPAVTVSVKN
jgi:hypothetical protein